MIPKIIHYCWLSDDPVPQKLKNYMQSWREKLPGYEFVLWNFKRFDKESCAWVKQAFDNKKYAFAADYIRIFALYKFGGIYLDMDVEVVKDFRPLLCLKSFICWQNECSGLEVAAMGAEKGCFWLKLYLDQYEKRSFVNELGFDMRPLPYVIEKILHENNINLKTVTNIDDAQKQENDFMPIFTCDFFSPKSLKTGIISTTKNTFCIHHFSGSWCEKKSLIGGKIYRLFIRVLGEKNADKVRSLWKFVKNCFSK